MDIKDYINQGTAFFMERGIAYDKKSDYNHAIPDFEMVLKFAPDNNTARELLQMVKANK